MRRCPRSDHLDTVACPALPWLTGNKVTIQSHSRLRVQFCLFIFVTAAGALQFCAPAPDSYPPPAQYKMPPGPEPAIPPLDPARALLEMSDADLEAHIVRDIFASHDETGWCWTGEHPAVRLNPGELKDTELYLRFAVPEQTFRVTGPVTVTVRIGDRVLDRFRIDRSREREYRRPVAAQDVASRPIVLSLDVAPTWISPSDGVRLGVLLHSIGFRARLP